MKRLLSSLFALAIVLGGCEIQTKPKACVIKEYQDQTYVQKDLWDSRGSNSALPNFNAFHAYADIWLIPGLVKRADDVSLRLSADPVASIDNVSPDTTLLVSVLQNLADLPTVADRFFHSKDAPLYPNSECVIYSGSRNGVHTVLLGTKEHPKREFPGRRECIISATLLYFGVSTEDLQNPSEFVKDDILPSSWLYNKAAIVSAVEVNERCEAQ
jgi:hypothetical protein